MTFTIQSEGKGKITFPVNPQEYTISVSQKNTLTNVIQLGDVNLIGKTGLREVSLSSFFPAQDYNFGSSIEDPITTVETLDNWRKAGSPCRVIIGRVLNMECTIESFSWGEKDPTGDIYFTLILKEYVRIKLTKIATTDNQAEIVTTEQRETKEPEKGKTYTVKSGDCLWKIAKQFYGNGSQYMKIYNANKDKLDNPNRIYPGQILTIP